MGMYVDLSLHLLFYSSLLIFAVVSLFTAETLSSDSLVIVYKILILYVSTNLLKCILHIHSNYVKTFTQIILVDNIFVLLFLISGTIF